MNKIEFPVEWAKLVAGGADALRALALNENVKARISADPALEAVARRVSQRFIGGETALEALDVLASINEKGHRATVDYMGESCRDVALAHSETEAFLALIGEIERRKIDSTISLDLSHVGSAISPEVGYANASRIAKACNASGREMIVSMEGSDRTDLTLNLYRKLSGEFGATVGITLQARLHRTAHDLPAMLQLPGKSGL